MVIIMLLLLNYDRKRYNRGSRLSRLVGFDYYLICLFDYWSFESFTPAAIQWNYANTRNRRHRPAVPRIRPIFTAFSCRQHKRPFAVVPAFVARHTNRKIARRPMFSRVCVSGGPCLGLPNACTPHKLTEMK